MKRRLSGAMTAMALAMAALAPLTSAHAQTPWAMDKAAAPLKNTQIKTLFLDRPGYRAIIKLFKLSKV